VHTSRHASIITTTTVYHGFRAKFNLYPPHEKVFRTAQKQVGRLRSRFRAAQKQVGRLWSRFRATQKQVGRLRDSFCKLQKLSFILFEGYFELQKRIHRR